MNLPTKACAILLAGGSGSRMGGTVEDKILYQIAGKPVWRHSFDAFIKSGCIQNLIFVCRDSEQQETIESALPEDYSQSVTFTRGGEERQDSVWAGLQAADPDTEVILIHDLARALIAPETIREVTAAALQFKAACVARPTTDTIKRCKDDGETFTLETIDRSTLWSMETPQAFAYPLIRDAYKTIIEQGQKITDDLSAIESSKKAVKFVINTHPNPKLTTQRDLAYLEFLLSE